MRTDNGPTRYLPISPFSALFTLVLLGANALFAQPVITVDIANLTPTDGTAFWAYGSVGQGFLGLPVAANGDIDGDGHPDLAVAFMRASPFGRTHAGEVDLIFGDGTVSGFVDTATQDPRILRFAGDSVKETAGGQIWMDDVTGDGLADLLIGRQNHTPDADRLGAGALTIVPGGAHLRALVDQGGWVDLRQPPSGLPLTTLIGAGELDRFGFWVRTGDVDGDGIADLIVGADQEDGPSQLHRGAAWMLHGGAHLANAGLVDLANFGATVLQGHVAKILPPNGSTEHHFGATAILEDLDGNHRAEAIVAATLNRGGGIIAADGAPAGSAHGSGGAPNGEVFILWDDNFPDPPWTSGLTISLESPPATVSRLRGTTGNVSFGEELIGGLDFDGDGAADLFSGDLAGDATVAHNRPTSGIGQILFDAVAWRGRDVDLDSLPTDLRVSTILGGETAALGGDTATQGDFDADGHADLAFTSPHANPLGRTSAGAIHVLFGGNSWPEIVDLGAIPSPTVLRVTEIFGARGTLPQDEGDTIGYSAVASDLDGDGHTDLITNEMVGNGLGPGTIDVGNLIALSGILFAPTSSDCTRGPHTACLLGGRFEVEGEMLTFAVPPSSFPATVMQFVGRAESDLAVFLQSFAPGNFEVGVKMVDACGPGVPPSQRGHWLFLGGLTNADTTLLVEDTARPGDVFDWHSPAGEFAQTLGLTPAFACEELQSPSCVRTDQAACLQDRFRVSGQMLDFADPPTTFATSVMEFDGRAESDQAVFFESFAPGNFEIGVKMVDACGLPAGHPQRGYWTFYGGLTNAVTEVRVTDTETGQLDVWTVESGTFPSSEGRTPAFPCDD